MSVCAKSGKSHLKKNYSLSLSLSNNNRAEINLRDDFQKVCLSYNFC